MAKVKVAADEPEGNTESSVPLGDSAYVQELLPHVLRLTHAILHCTRWSYLHSMSDQTDTNEKLSLQDLEGIQDVLAICSLKNPLTTSFAQELTSALPNCFKSIQVQSNTALLPDISLVSNAFILNDKYIRVCIIFL